MATSPLRADSAHVTPCDIAKAADDLQAHLRRIASLNSAVDHETDFAADIDREQILGRLGRVCDFLGLQSEEVEKALLLAERIEVTARAAGRE